MMVSLIQLLQKRQGSDKGGQGNPQDLMFVPVYLFVIHCSAPFYPKYNSSGRESKWNQKDLADFLSRLSWIFFRR